MKFTIKREVLRAMADICGNGDIRSWINCVYFRCNDGKLQAFSTDGSMAARIEFDNTADKNSDWLGANVEMILTAIKIKQKLYEFEVINGKIFIHFYSFSLCGECALWRSNPTDSLFKSDAKNVAPIHGYQAKFVAKITALAQAVGGPSVFGALPFYESDDLTCAYYNDGKVSAVIMGRRDRR